MPITRRDALKSAAAAALLPAPGRAGAQVPTPDAVAKKLGDVIAREANGTVVHQITTAREHHSNIYCEIPYCSRDSRYLVYQVITPARKENPVEFRIVELGAWKEHRLDGAASAETCAITPDGIFYYFKQVGPEQVLMRVDLQDGTPEAVYRRPFGLWLRSLGTVSPDGRYFAGGVAVDDKYDMFGIVLVDLKTGKDEIIHRDPFIFNPHPQFEPGEGKLLLVQQNRGGRVTPENKVARSEGPAGATLYVISVPDGKRTPLKIGPPHTTAITGHQTWIGKTGEVLASVLDRGAFVPERGNLLGVRPGGDHRVVANGHFYNHLGTPPAGTLFSADDFRGTFDLIVGNPQTGRTAVLCPSRTTATASQATHPHPYLTPDLKWMIFNSTRSGLPHVYAARVPDDLVQSLLPA